MRMIDNSSAGNLACVTLADGDAADCGHASGSSASTNLLARYPYNYLERLVICRSFVTNGVTSTADNVADYEHDALDRVNNRRMGGLGDIVEGLFGR